MQDNSEWADGLYVKAAIAQLLQGHGPTSYPVMPKHNHIHSKTAQA